MHRATALLGIALPLTGVDLLWKSLATTPYWAYHARSPGWLALSLGLVGGALALTRTGSRAVLVSGGIMAGGLLGNALSASWNDLRVPDPIVATPGDAIVAFNLADVFTVCGTLALTAAIGVVVIRNRGLLPREERSAAICSARSSE